MPLDTWVREHFCQVCILSVWVNRSHMLDHSADTTDMEKLEDKINRWSITLAGVNHSFPKYLPPTKTDSKKYTVYFGHSPPHSWALMWLFKTSISRWFSSHNFFALYPLYPGVRCAFFQSWFLLYTHQSLHSACIMAESTLLPYVSLWLLRWRPSWAASKQAWSMPSR